MEKESKGWGEIDEHRLKRDDKIIKILLVLAVIFFFLGVGFSVYNEARTSAAKEADLKILETHFDNTAPDSLKQKRKHFK